MGFWNYEMCNLIGSFSSIRQVALSWVLVNRDWWVWWWEDPRVRWNLPQEWDDEWEPLVIAQCDTPGSLLLQTLLLREVEKKGLWMHVDHLVKLGWLSNSQILLEALSLSRRRKGNEKEHRELLSMTWSHLKERNCEQEATQGIEWTHLSKKFLMDGDWLAESTTPSDLRQLIFDACPLDECHSPALMERWRCTSSTIVHPLNLDLEDTFPNFPLSHPSFIVNVAMSGNLRLLDHMIQCVPAFRNFDHTHLVALRLSERLKQISHSPGHLNFRFLMEDIYRLDDEGEGQQVSDMNPILNFIFNREGSHWHAMNVHLFPLFLSHCYRKFLLRRTRRESRRFRDEKRLINFFRRCICLDQTTESSFQFQRMKSMWFAFPELHATIFDTLSRAARSTTEGKLKHQRVLGEMVLSFVPWHRVKWVIRHSETMSWTKVRDLLSEIKLILPNERLNKLRHLRSDLRQEKKTSSSLPEEDITPSATGHWCDVCCYMGKGKWNLFDSFEVADSDTFFNRQRLEVLQREIEIRQRCCLLGLHKILAIGYNLNLRLTPLWMVMMFRMGMRCLDLPPHLHTCQGELQRDSVSTFRNSLAQLGQQLTERKDRHLLHWCHKFEKKLSDTFK